MVAMAASIAAVYPHMNHIGGDGFWMVREPKGLVRALMAAGFAGAKAQPELYRAHETIPARGPLAALTVPGAIGGWSLALELAKAHGGRMPLDMLLGAAILLVAGAAATPIGIEWAAALGVLTLAAAAPGLRWAALAGLIFQKQAETTLRTPIVIGSMMIGIGLVLWFAERAGRRQKDLSHVSFADSLSVGAAQALAVVPGVSRSGITIAAGLFRNLDRATAARFSFLLSTPVIAGAAAKDFWDLMRHQGGIPPEMRPAFLIGMVVSAVVGGLTIKFFLDYLKRRGLTCFVLYRLIFGIMVIALAHFFRYSGG